MLQLLMLSLLRLLQILLLALAYWPHLDQPAFHSVVVIYAALLALQAAEPFLHFCLCLVPGYLLQELKPMLTNMRLLKKLSTGTSLFVTPTKSGTHAAMPGTSWPVYIHFDVAADVTDITVEGTPHAKGADYPSWCSKD